MVPQLVYPVLWIPNFISVADPESGALLTPGSGMGKKIRIRIRDEQPGSYFRELRNHFFGLNFRMEKFGSGSLSRIRNTEFYWLIGLAFVS
jgi:hypothetical protein